MRLLIFAQKNNCFSHAFQKTNLVDYVYKTDVFLEKFYLYDYDLILFNIFHLEEDHLKAIEEIKAENTKVPILCCMEKISPLIIDKFLTLGVNNLLLRSCDSNFVENNVVLGSLSLNFESNSFFILDRELFLRKKEFLLLKYLILNQKQFLSKNKIINQLIENAYERDSNLVEVYIYRLRKILRENSADVKIISKKNFGYRITAC